MSSTDYSYFNPNNYNTPFPALSNLWSSVTTDFHMLPSYSVYNTQLMTYFLIGVTAITLGYVTIKEKEPENPTESEEPKTTGGKSKKSKTTRKNKK
jgi:hypothetical protein